MTNKAKRCTISIIAMIIASHFSIMTYAEAANLPGGRLTGQISEDRYIVPSDITTMNNFYNSLRDENIESTGSSIHKVANFDDIRTAGGSDYSENGVAYYDMNNGRGVSFTKLTGTNSIYGSISDIFGVNGQYDKDSVIPSQVRAAYTNFQTLQSNQSYIVLETSKERITDFLSALGEYFHFLPHHPYDNLTYSTYLNPNGITSLIGGTIPQTQYNGYRAEFESKDIRKSPILNNGMLTEEGLKMVNGGKTFLADNQDNPYGDLFQAAHDDNGNLDNSKIIEDSYILIRRLLGVNNNDENGIPKSLAANDTSRNSVCTSSQNLSSWVSQANELTNYPSERQEWTIKNRVEPEVKRLEEEIKALTEENERLAEQIAEIEKAMSDAINAAIKAYNEAMSSFSASMSNYKGQGTPPSPPSPPNISGIVSSFQSQITTINAKISENNQKIQEDYKLILEWKDPEGEKQLNAREEYNGLCSDKYAKYKVAVELFDGNGNLPDIQYGNGMRSGQSMSELGGETIPLPTDPNDIEGLLWYLWVSEGITEIPDKINSIEQLVGYDEAEKIKEFRVWLIQNEIYLNPGYSEGNGYTLNKDIWDAGELLKLWAAVYYIPASENIGKCLDTLNYSDELQSIADSIEANASATEYNKIDPTFYPYLKGYTNASFVPDNIVAEEKKIGKVKVTVIKSIVADYSLYDNAMAFFHKLGMDSEENANIPSNKHMNLGFYKDVEVTGYSNNYVKTDGILGRYEWYVYFNESGNRGNAEVVYHNTTTTLECPFTAIQEGTYWIDCYQSGYTTYEERMRYTSTYFLTEETTHTILMSSLTPDIQVLLDSKTVAEKIKLKTDEEGYIVSDSAMQWRAAGDRVVANFSTQRVSDTGDINLG